MHQLKQQRNLLAYFQLQDQEQEDRGLWGIRNMLTRS